MTVPSFQPRGTSLFLWIGFLIAFSPGLAIGFWLDLTATPAGTLPTLLLMRLAAAVLGIGPLAWLWSLSSRQRRLPRRYMGWLYGAISVGCSLLGAGVIQLGWNALGQRSLVWETGFWDAAYFLGVNLVVGYVARRDTAAREAIAAGEKETQAALRLLESARVMDRRAKTQRHADILRPLEQRVSPRLAAMIAALDELPTCPQDEAQSRLGAILDQLEDLREREVRGLSHLLHPSCVDVGMVPAFYFLVERFDPDLEIDLDLPLAKPSEPAPETRLVFYRCVEEALENVRRHAGVRRATLRWQEDGAGWTLTVQDEGRGFDASREAFGLGLHMLAGRVELTRGKFTIDSVPGRGTMLQVHLPRT